MINKLVDWWNSIDWYDAFLSLTILALGVFLLVALWVALNAPPKKDNEYCKSVFTGYVTVGKVMVPQFRSECITPVPNKDR